LALLGVPVVGFVVGKVIHTFVWVVFLLQIPITAAHQAGQHGASGSELSLSGALGHRTENGFAPRDASGIGARDDYHPVAADW
jgi:hypothetical protein